MHVQFSDFKKELQRKQQGKCCNLILFTIWFCSCDFSASDVPKCHVPRFTCSFGVVLCFLSLCLTQLTPFISCIFYIFRSAGVWTVNEGNTVYRRKLEHLRCLCMGQLTHLKNLLHDRRKQVLLEWQLAGGAKDKGTNCVIVTLYPFAFLHSLYV